MTKPLECSDCDSVSVVATDCSCACQCYTCAVFHLETHDVDPCSAIHGNTAVPIIPIKLTPLELLTFPHPKEETIVQTVQPRKQEASRPAFNEDVVFHLLEVMLSLNWKPLDLQRTIASCSLVSKTWTHPAQTILARFPRFSNQSFHPDSIEWYFSYSEAIERVHRMTNWAFAALDDNVRGKSRCLDLSIPFPILDDGLAHRNLIQREDYHLLIRTLHKSPSVGLDASRLTKLTLAHWQPSHHVVDESAFSLVFPSLTCLAELDLEGFSGTWETIDAISHLTALKQLNLNGSWWTEDPLAPATQWIRDNDRWVARYQDDIGPALESLVNHVGKQLTHLGLAFQGNFVTASRALAILDKLESAEHLDFNLSIRQDIPLGPMVAEDAFPDFPPFAVDPMMPDELVSNHPFSLQVAKKLVALSALNSISLPGPCVDDAGVAHFLGNIKSPLKRFVCRGSWNVGLNVVPYLSVLGPSLHGVTVESSVGCALGHALHVQHARNCQSHHISLTHLDLVGCRNFSRESCRDLIRVMVSHGVLDKLQTLGVANNTCDDHIIPLAQCRQLSTVLALECPGITNVSLHRLRHHALHELDVRGCVEVTDVGLYALLKSRFSRLHCPMQVGMHPADQLTLYPGCSKGVNRKFLQEHFHVHSLGEARYIVTSLASPA